MADVYTSQFDPSLGLAFPRLVSSGPTIPRVADANARLSLIGEGVVVLGAGETSVNGFYWRAATLYNGKPYYIRSGEGLSTEQERNSVSWNGSRWRLYGPDRMVSFYQSAVADTEVYDATFVSTSGASPPPVIMHQVGSVTGPGYQVIQDSDGLTYTFNGDGADADAGLWVTGAGSTVDNGPYTFDGTDYTNISAPVICTISHGEWEIDGKYGSGETPAYAWQSAAWNSVGGDEPPPDVTRNPIASPANWTTVP